MRQAGFQTANNLATKVTSELGELETRMMDALDERDQEMHQTPPPPPPQIYDNHYPNEQALVMNKFLPGIMELLQKMSARMDTLEMGATKNNSYGIY